MVLNGDVLALNEAGFTQSTVEFFCCSTAVFSEVELRNPISGIVGCCAFAARGHVTVEPAMSLMNSRRRVCPLPCATAKPSTLRPGGE